MLRSDAIILACCVLAEPAAWAGAPVDGGTDMRAASAATPAFLHPVCAARLDAARGGFQLPSGLAVGLGIERTVAINGELVTQARFAIADVRTLSADQAAMAREAMASVRLVQNGAVSAQEGLPQPAPAAGFALGPVLGATFIQNSLDNQRIQSQTVIDASVNTLNGFKSLNFSSSMLDALSRAAAPH